MRKRSFLLVAGACVASLSLTAGMALADPMPFPPDRLLAGVGSDITQEIMNGFANGTILSTPAFAGIKNGADFVVSSFNADGSDTIITHPDITACSTGILRPRDTGFDTGNGDQANGVKAMNADTSGCIQFARLSSSSPTAASTLATSQPFFNDTFIPFAKEAFTFTNSYITNVPKNFTKAQLQAIYSRNFAQGCIRKPLLPKAPSRVRDAFLEFIMVGGLNQPPLGDCVKDEKPSGLIGENDGRVLTDPDEILPYSVGGWVDQVTMPGMSDIHGPSVLRRVDGVSPFDAAFPFSRKYFNVVRTADLGNANINTTFVGANSAICLHPEVIKVPPLKLSPASDCGSTTLQN